MAMVDVDGSSLTAYGGLKGQVGLVGLRVGDHLALSLHSSNEPGECWQWSRHDDSGISIIRSGHVLKNPDPVPSLSNATTTSFRFVCFTIKHVYKLTMAAIETGSTRDQPRSLNY